MLYTMTESKQNYGLNNFEPRKITSTFENSFQFVYVFVFVCALCSSRRIIFCFNDNNRGKHSRGNEAGIENAPVVSPWHYNQLRKTQRCRTTSFIKLHVLLCNVYAFIFFNAWNREKKKHNECIYNIRAIFFLFSRIAFAQRCCWRGNFLSAFFFAVHTHTHIVDKRAQITDIKWETKRNEN